MPVTFTYDPATDAGKVRLLLNDVDRETAVFTNAEIQAFLDLSDGGVLLAAAQAIDTNADNEALASKVLRTQDLGTNGAAVADALHRRAEALRHQATDLNDDGGWFEIIEQPSRLGIELAEAPNFYPWPPA